MQRPRSILAGSTNYTGMSISEMLEHVQEWRTNTQDAIKKLAESLSEVEDDRKIFESPEAAEQFALYMIDLFERYDYDLSRLEHELPSGVRGIHIDLLKDFLQSLEIGEEACVRFKNDWINKALPDNSARPILDNIYREARNQINDFLDLSNFGHRLKTFVGVSTGSGDTEYLSKEIPAELRSACERFRQDHSIARKCGFLMMKFEDSRLHKEIAEAAQTSCEPYGITIMRADNKQYADDLLSNLRVYMHCCSFGVALVERLSTDDLNPNVSLEVGYMMALGKPVCLLKDSTLKSLQTDLAGRLYLEFDTQQASGTLGPKLVKWLRDKAIIPQPAGA